MIRKLSNETKDAQKRAKYLETMGRPAPNQKKADKRSERAKNWKPFEHNCVLCGEWGSFGYGVALLNGHEGTWYCYRHWPRMGN